MDYKTLSVDDFMIGELDIEHISPTLISESVNFNTVAMSRGIHRITVSGNIMLETQEDVRKWQAFIMGLKGQATPFILDCGDNGDWHNPFFLNASGFLSTDANIGQTNIACTGTNSMRNGALIQFGDYTKVYIITSVAAGRIEVYPPVQHKINAGTQIKFHVKPLLRLTKDNFKIVFGARCKEVSFEANEEIQ